MGMFDGILSQIGGNLDVQSIADRVGLPHDQVEQAIAALSSAHAEPGDTVASAAQSTGMPAEQLQQIMGHLGGEGALGKLSSLMGNASGSLGGALGGITGMFGGGGGGE